jgi:hypothetical protein
VTKKGTNPLLELRADNVLEFAGMRIGFGFNNRKCIGEEALG